MKFIKIPGINGLGLTSPAKDFAQLLVPNVQEIKLNHHDITEQEQTIYQEVKKLLPEPLFIIGGDHSISFPIGKAFKEQYDNPALIIFDAHADCMPPLREPTHEEWLSALVNEGFPTKNIIIIGLRKVEKVEQDFLDKNNITTLTSQQIKDNPQQSINQIINFTKDKNIYISFDIDSLDPSIAPATYYLEPKGLTLQQVHEYIQAIPRSQIKLIDLVEIHTNQSKRDLQKTLDSAKQLINYFTL